MWKNYPWNVLIVRKNVKNVDNSTIIANFTIETKKKRTIRTNGIHLSILRNDLSINRSQETERDVIRVCKKSQSTCISAVLERIYVIINRCELILIWRSFLSRVFWRTRKKPPYRHRLTVLVFAVRAFLPKTDCGGVRVTHLSNIAVNNCVC